MAERGVLHISYLDRFAAYLQEQGYQQLPLSRNDYEVLRMKKDKRMVVLYKRLGAKEHLSVMDKDMPLVRAFFREGSGGGQG